MDILIMALLLAIVLLIYRGAKRSIILSLWVLGIALCLALFNYHVTSNLNLSF